MCIRDRCSACAPLYWKMTMNRLPEPGTGSPVLRGVGTSTMAVSGWAMPETRLRVTGEPAASVPVLSRIGRHAARQLDGMNSGIRRGYDAIDHWSVGYHCPGDERVCTDTSNGTKGRQPEP